MSTWAAPIPFNWDEGISARNRTAPDPLMHILIPDGSGWAIWCGGSYGLRRRATTSRKCPRCQALLRADAANEGDPLRLDGLV